MPSSWKFRSPSYYRRQAQRIAQLNLKNDISTEDDSDAPVKEADAMPTSILSNVTSLEIVDNSKEEPFESAEQFSKMDQVRNSISEVEECAVEEIDTQDNLGDELRAIIEIEIESYWCTVFKIAPPNFSFINLMDFFKN